MSPDPSAISLDGPSRAEVPLPPGKYLISLVGSSMEPILLDGDRLLVEVGVTAHRFGDVLLVRHGNVLYIHRIVGRAHGRLRTKGDGRPHMDGWLSDPADVLGVVLGGERGGRWRRFEGAPARILGVMAGVFSALCGHLYRVALVFDLAVAGEGGDDFRKDVARLNRTGFLGIDALLRIFVDREPSAAPTCKDDHPTT